MIIIVVGYSSLMDTQNGAVGEIYNTGLARQCESVKIENLALKQSFEQ